MDLSRPKFLALARKLALLTSTAAPTLVACASSQPPVNNPSPVATTTAATTTGEPAPDPTVGSGPCRCSWDGNKDAAPRVCKKGETNYDGEKCVPGGGTSYGGYEGSGGPVMKGPLPPPDLPVSV